jgi:hypothetical protein
LLKKGDQPDWDNLYAQVASGGFLAALMYDLMNEDLDGWNPAKRPSVNVQKSMEMKYQSMSIEEKFVFDWIECREVEKYEQSKRRGDGYVINFKLFYEEYKRWLDDSGLKNRYLTAQHLSMKLLGKLVPAKKTKIGGETFWDFPSWDEIYSFYCEDVLYENPGWNKIVVSEIVKKQYEDLLIFDNDDPAASYGCASRSPISEGKLAQRISEYSRSGKQGR